MLLRIVGSLKKSITFAPAMRQQHYCCSSDSGTLDEWLSQRSAKPRTAVRIRQVPQSLQKLHRDDRWSFCHILAFSNLTVCLP